MKKELEGNLERELKQLERLQFVYEAAKRDAAYYRALEGVQEGDKPAARQVSYDGASDDE